MNLSCTTPYNAALTERDESTCFTNGGITIRGEEHHGGQISDSISSEQPPYDVRYTNSLVGAYLLSDNVIVSKSVFMDCVIRIPQWDGQFGKKNILVKIDINGYQWSTGNEEVWK